MEPRILVTGGTGTIGQHVVARLIRLGYEVRVLSRRARDDMHGVEFVVGDLLKDEGFDGALDGAAIIVHCAGGRTGDDDAMANLARAASRAKTQHLVFISVIGVDRIPQVSRVDRAMFGYFGSKLRAERILAESSVPSTTLRCAQVHESLQMVLKPLTRLPLIPVPAGFCFQPIAADEVAQRIVELTFAAPAGLVSDIAGPRVQPMADLLREYLQTVGKRRLVVPLRVPGAAARAFRAGANLAPDHPTGRRTWQEFLAARCLSDADRQTRGARLREVTRHELA